MKTFDGCVVSNIKVSKKPNVSRGNGKFFPGPVESPSASILTINISLLLLRSIPPTSFRSSTIYGTWIQHLICHSNAFLIGIFGQFIILNQQLINLTEIYVRFSNPFCRWTIGGRVAPQTNQLRFFSKKIT